MKSFKTSAASLPEITDRMSGEPAEGTLVDLLVARAGEGSHGPAFRLLDDQGKRSAEMSTVELDRSARAIALALSTALKPGDRALLLYPPGLDFIAAFFGCLYAGVVAVPAYPPDPSRLNRSLERLRVVLVDARPSVVLTTSSGKIAARLILRRAADLQSIPWIATDRLGGAGEAQWRRPDISARTLAFLQYTSGSTGAPKGVMVTHQNLLENLRMIQTVSGTSPESIGVSWLPQYHDMGLVTGILQPLYAGFSVTYLSPVTFLRTPVRWLQAISQNRATHSGAPNFAYDLCVRKVTPEERSQLDLSTWRVAYDAAEIVRPETLDRFTDAFSRCGFRREAFLIGYGLAEATVLVSSSTTELRAAVHAIDPAELLRGRVRVVAASEGLGVVGCGRSPSPGQSIRIVDPATRAPCDPGRVGEIWVAGPGVAAGYWNRPEETRETFDARLANDGAGPYLRTGDLGFVLDDQLHIAGRIKDLIIIRGANHHPEDIEHTIAGCHPAIRPGCCAAFSVDVAGEERLVVAAEIRGSRPSRKIPKLIRLARRSLGRIIGLRRNSGELPHEDGAKIAAAIRHAVARDHDPPVFDIVLVGPGALPKTSSGKIQRHACRRGYLEGRLEDVLGRFPLGAEEPADQASRSAGTSISRNTADLTGETGTQQIERAVCQAVGELARVPPESIRREQRLVADLGLDSLTRTELYFRLGKMFPSLDEADPSWQAEDLTIGAVIDYVSGLPVKELQTDST